MCGWSFLPSASHDSPAVRRKGIRSMATAHLLEDSANEALTHWAKKSFALSALSSRLRDR